MHVRSTPGQALQQRWDRTRSISAAGERDQAGPAAWRPLGADIRELDRHAVIDSTGGLTVSKTRDEEVLRRSVTKQAEARSLPPFGGAPSSSQPRIPRLQIPDFSKGDCEWDGFGRRYGMKSSLRTGQVPSSMPSPSRLFNPPMPTRPRQGPRNGPPQNPGMRPVSSPSCRLGEKNGVHSLGEFRSQSCSSYRVIWMRGRLPVRKPQILVARGVNRFAVLFRSFGYGRAKEG